MTGLPDRLVFERNRIRDVLGERWKAALLLEAPLVVVPPVWAEQMSLPQDLRHQNSGRPDF